MEELWTDGRMINKSWKIFGKLDWKKFFHGMEKRPIWKRFFHIFSNNFPTISSKTLLTFFYISSKILPYISQASLLNNTSPVFLLRFSISFLYPTFSSSTIISHMGEASARPIGSRRNLKRNLLTKQDEPEQSDTETSKHQQMRYQSHN